MANEQIIDSVVSADANKQVSDLTKLLNSLDIELVQNAKDASALNSVLLNNAKSFSQLNKDALAASLANEKLSQAQNKTAITASQLQKAEQAKESQIIRTQQAQDRATASQDKAAAAAQKALSPYQQLSKQLETLRANAKDIGVTFGQQSEQFKAASKPVQELDAKLKGIDQTLGQSQRNVGNYGNSFKDLIASFVPFGSQINKAVDGVSSLSKETLDSKASLSGLSADFVGFATGAFVVAVASATYYLSQFQSVGNKVSETLSGLKSGFAFAGQQLIDPASAKGSVYDAYKQGKSNAAVNIDLQNAQTVRQQNNATLQVQSEYFRALSNDRTLDIVDRQKYLSNAQGIEKQILKNSQDNAKQTLDVAIKLGFQSTTLTQQQQDQQRKVLLAAAQKGNLAPGQALSLNGQQFTSAGFDLYKQGVAQLTEAQRDSANEIIKINADKANMEFRADKALAAAIDQLQKANIQGVLDVANLTLKSNTATNKQKLAANSDYVTQSIKLIKIEEASRLDAAGLGAGRSGKDSRTQAVQRSAIEQETQNDINKILADGMKNRQDLSKSGLEAELRLYKARVDGVQDTERSIIDDTKAGYQKRIDANDKFISDSLALLKKEKSVALAEARPEDRLAVEQEFQNKRQQIANTGAKQRETIEKDLSDSLKKSLEDILKTEQDTADKTIVILTDQNDKSLQEYEDERNGQSEIADKLYAKGKISEQKYRDDLLQIEDEYNVKRLQKQLDTDKAILAVRQAEYNNALNDVAGDPDAVPDNIKSALKTATATVATGTTALSGAKAKQGNDNTSIGQQLTDGQKDAIAAIQDAQQLEQDGSKLVQEEYQHEIELLEKKRTLIDENAQAEITGVNNSILSERDKQNKINVINAQAAQAQAVLTQKENQIKRKAAVEEKVANAASIVENTAVAAIKTYAELGYPFGIPAAIIVAALGAAELATALAAPLPTFAKGGITKGGSLLWGEAGVELATEPGGKQYLSTGPTIANMPKGTKITPHMDLMRMIKPDNTGYAGGEQIGWREVIEAIERNKPIHNKPNQTKVIIHDDYSRKQYLRR